MRIIGGSFKGKSISFLKNLKTRPLKDMVKENIFNILSHSNLIKVQIENSHVLDLYSGIGSFGLECISRGAKKVTFVEQNIDALNVLNENIDKLSINKESEVFNIDIENFLKQKLKKKFDIFFFDPPFADLKFINNLRLIKRKNIFKKNHIVIIHRERRNDDNFKKLIDIILVKQYGRSKIIFGLFS